MTRDGDQARVKSEEEGEEQIGLCAMREMDTAVAQELQQHSVVERAALTVEV